MRSALRDIRSCPRIVCGLACCCGELLRVEAGEVRSGSHGVCLRKCERRYPGIATREDLYIRELSMGEIESRKTDTARGRSWLRCCQGSELQMPRPRCRWTFPVKSFAAPRIRRATTPPEHHALTRLYRVN